MDARKIEFLISLQKEIDRLEQSKGSDSTRLEKIKSRFYELVRVEEINTTPSTSLPIDKDGIEADISDSDIEKTLNNPQEDILNMPQRGGSDNSSKKIERHRGPIMPVPLDIEMKLRRKILENPLETSIVDSSKLDNNVDLITVLNKSQTLKDLKEWKTEGYHKPKDVADFMNLFNNPEGLKYLTHDWDEEVPFEIDSFLESQKSIFQDNSKHFKIPRALWVIINHFAFSEKPNWGNKNKDGWSTDERIEWSKRNGKSILCNAEFVKIKDYFINMVRIEPPNLKIIFEDTLKEKLNDRYELFQKELKLANCETAYFYTNVSTFRVALKHILDGIYKRAEISTKLKIEYHREMDGDYQKRIIRICHFYSFPLRPIDEVIDEIPSGKGDFYEIYKRLRGYCHWEIETCWDKRNVRLSILNEEDAIKAMPLDDSLQMDGFTHILTFYYR